MTPAQQGPLSLSAHTAHVRAQLLEAFQQPASEEQLATIDILWRTCIGIYNLAKEHRNQKFLVILERMVNTIADFKEADQSETHDWQSQLPTVAEIEADAPS